MPKRYAKYGYIYIYIESKTKRISVLTKNCPIMFKTSQNTCMKSNAVI